MSTATVKDCPRGTRAKNFAAGVVALVASLLPLPLQCAFIDIVVAVIGHLYSKNNQRGVFNSFDGGKTWEKSLFLNDNTGAIDLVYDPENFNVQYAAFWERSRTAWNFIGSGDNSGIYKTEDGGKNWKKQDMHKKTPQNQKIKISKIADTSGSYF